MKTYFFLNSSMFNHKATLAHIQHVWKSKYCLMHGTSYISWWNDSINLTLCTYRCQLSHFYFFSYETTFLEPIEPSLLCKRNHSFLSLSFTWLNFATKSRLQTLIQCEEVKSRFHWLKIGDSLDTHLSS